MTCEEPASTALHARGLSPALISQQILLWVNVSLEKRDGTG